MHDYTVPPGQPQELQVTDIRTTSTFIQWRPPSNSITPIAHYVISAIRIGHDGAALVIEIDTAATILSYNVTGLLPGTTYELTVVAVSQGGNVVAKSQPSNSVIITTNFSGKLYLNNQQGVPK